MANNPPWDSNANHAANGGVAGPMGPSSTAKNAQLVMWMNEMYAWGQAVRRDIIRLEGAAGLPPGDPEDPPKPPWD